MTRLREMIDTPALIYGDHPAAVDECYRLELTARVRVRQAASLWRVPAGG
jgi:hypothetical protein